MPYLLGIAAGFYVNMRVGLTSLERVLEYLRIPIEPPPTLPSDPPVDQWPKVGQIEFEHLSVRYRKGLPLAVEDLSMVIPSQQKSAIIGRTGSGKSTLILALFRIVEPEGGTIKIDGLDVATLGLDRARGCLNVIPQEPVLHAGSVKHNLDPFGNVGDEGVKQALVRARLPESLIDMQLEKGGSNLSSGERQLLCFARALLNASSRPILVLDEATSNLDVASDAAVQGLLRSEFTGKTILTIAHRLTTIIDYDQLFVMGGGKLLEAGVPSELLRKEGSVFGEMARSLGEDAEAELRAAAVK